MENKEESHVFSLAESSLLQKRNLIEVSKRHKGKGNQGAPMIVTLTAKADPQTKERLDLFEKLASVFK